MTADIKKKNATDTSGKPVKEKKGRQKYTEVDEAILKDSYWLNRVFFLRSLAFIYFVAFLVALHQNKALLGNNGLLPTDKYLKLIKNHFGSKNLHTAFVNIPTLLLFTKDDDIDWWLDALAYTGLMFSGFVLLTGAANMLIMGSLWMLYHSIVNIGQRWYSFGWESQLLETGFLAIFFCPFLHITPYPENTPPSKTVIWGYRWLIFRIMLGAGLIKIRSDECWRDLTCMNYHYETQPVPNPLSYYLHQTPEFMHNFETLGNHFIELIAPFFLLLTRRFRIISGLLQIFFQVLLILSGNLSFLNWLTILPSLACFDDHFLCIFFSTRSQNEARRLRKNADKKAMKSWGSSVRAVLDYILACLLIVLSIPVVQNLLSSHQAMNTSFDSFRIVNTYGAFGSITKTRTEVIIQGTRNLTLIPDEHGGLWKEYDFKCKPGLVTRRPCLISPYHYRLDWLMWFAAFMNYQQNPWLLHFTAKLLVNDPNVTSLLAHNPFEDGPPPRYIRGEHYEYKYTRIGSEEARSNWWSRKKIGSYFPPVNLDALDEFLKRNGWDTPVLDE
ncbi:lipase maturation factor 1-like [Hydractinia symbiolongicarpus]|uniref:lipase maturation factor 1-like n=1 Tax=Hydractinia symbiolongicarpus TaxID=13093 RepID=UPI00254F614D|nr:lipase maturation factor 1-like [Hydractinia symbiolongicarpus]